MLVCNICNRSFKSIQSIKVHLPRTHNIRYEDYLIKYDYNGLSPLCKCGCGEKTKYFRGHFRDYLQGHFLRHNKYLYSVKINEKRKETNIKKYGGPSPSSSLEVQQKIKETNIKKYGGPSPSSSKEVRKKIVDTNLKRYGVESPLQNSSIYKKVKQTNILKYGVDNTFKLKKNIEKFKENLRFSFEDICKIAKAKNYSILFEKEDYVGCRQFLPFKCLKHNKVFASSVFNVQTDFHQCSLCKRVGISKKEKEVVSFINSVMSEFLMENSRIIIPPKELDIYIPNKKLAIEFNGLFWHSDKFQHNNKNLIYNKFVECNKKNIHLLQIYEDEWRDKKHIWESIIKNHLGLSSRLFARKCEIREDIKEEKNFINDNHLQGYVSSLKSFGLCYNGEIVCLLSFRKPLKYKPNYIEISRFCSKKNYTVVGGFSKLLKHAINWITLNNYSKIITYSDCRLSKGNVYENNGFVFVKHTGLDYFYTDTIDRYHRFKFRAKNDKTEKEIAEINNVYKIYGAGHYLWELKL